jgi:hypothetical protein
MAGSAAVGAAGGWYGKKHMDKRASELTSAELIEGIANSVLVGQNAERTWDAAVDSNIEKIASSGVVKAEGFMARHGKKLKEHYEAAKQRVAPHLKKGKAHLERNKGRYGLLAGAAAGAGGMHAAHKHGKK